MSRSIRFSPSPWIRRISVGVSLTLAGCAPPLLEYGLESPAAMLAPIGAAPVGDGRARFREIFCQVLADATDAGKYGSERNCHDYLIRLEDEPAADTSSPPHPRHNTNLRIVLVPGAFSECFGTIAEPFRDGAKQLGEIGYNVKTLKLNGRSGTEENATKIAAALRETELSPGERFVLVGYSKGANDILSFLVAYPDLAKQVAAAVSIAGSISGSPLAEHYADLYANWFSKLEFPTCGPGDGFVVESIRRDAAMSWLASHSLPAQVQYYSLGSFAESRHIARILRFTVRGDLSRVDPRNDGQTLYYDQLVPGSVLLGYANGDHWSVALTAQDSFPFFAGNSASKEEFPRAELLEAVMLFVIERLSASQSPTTLATEKGN